jgi:hypothetical protein
MVYLCYYMLLGYGYLRAAWNTNPNPYLSRYSCNQPSLPTCTEYYDILLNYDSYDDLFHTIQFFPHGSVHRAIAGFMGCDLLDEFVESGALQESERVPLCNFLDFMTKELYRSYAISPRTDCEYHSSTSFDCGYICTSKDTFKLYMKANLGKFSDAPVTNKTDAALNQWYNWYCNGDGHKYTYADHLEAASTADPSFWSIHPTMERTVHLALIAKRFTVFNWEELGVDVCDKDKCFENGVESKYTMCCDGHYYEDALLDFVSGDRFKTFGKTNREIWEGVDATKSTYSMPYIYDKFTYSHCTDDDTNIDKDLETYISSY